MRKIVRFSLHCFPSSRGFAASEPFFAKKVVPYLLNDIGEGIKEVGVLQAFVKAGDTIKQRDKVCEVQSDKATVEITSRFDGLVKKVHFEVGQTIQIKSVLIDVEIEDDGSVPNSMPVKKVQQSPSPPAPAAAAVPPASAGAPPSSSGASSSEAIEKALATPATRRIARENNIDLSKVRATGKGGRVMKEDVLAYLEGAQSGSAAPTIPSPTATGAEDRVIPMTGIRKVMVRTMTEANKIPAFSAKDEIELTNLVAMRDMFKVAVAERDKSLKVSFMPFFIKAASIGLKRYPELNAFTNADCTELTVKAAHNIGFAMDTPQGLIVPCIRNVESKTLLEIVADINGLIERGKRGAITPADLQGGTFTISNIGSIGATYTVPVIFPPQVAIGAIGRMQTLPRFDADGNVVKAQIVNVSWSADHRVVDGATMVRFNNVFKQLLENPALMLLDTK
jgi:2-oxoisovalerate dehydrogenase E2 component (dihydrolipoyl transacylase)